MNKFIDVVLTETPTDEHSGFEIAGINTISQSDVDRMIVKTDVMTMGGKTTVVQVTLLNGFILTESSACVDPANYDEAIGIEICLDRIKNQIWFLLGFLLQSALYGFDEGNR